MNHQGIGADILALVEQAAAALRGGRLVAMPTETVYGLAANAEDPAAVGRIFAAKGRPTNHPLIVHHAPEHDLATWAREVPNQAHKLAEKFWPGPLTLLLRRGPRVNLATTGGLDTVALRVPNHPIALALLRSFGGAVAAPSANRFGSVSPTCAAHVRDDLGNTVDIILDGGPCAVGIESTIVDLTNPLVPRLLRPGGTTVEELEDTLGQSVLWQPTPSVPAPGALASHYAPKATVVLIEADHLEQALACRSAERVAVLRETNTTQPRWIDDGEIQWFDLPCGAGFARHLYQSLREADRRACTTVLAIVPSHFGLGLALIDRLTKAAGPR